MLYVNHFNREHILKNIINDAIITYANAVIGSASKFFVIGQTRVIYKRINSGFHLGVVRFADSFKCFDNLLFLKLPDRASLIAVCFNYFKSLINGIRRLVGLFCLVIKPDNL